MDKKWREAIATAAFIVFLVFVMATVVWAGISKVPKREPDPVTLRGIDINLGQKIASMEERIRLLEILQGGGTQQRIKHTDSGIIIALIQNTTYTAEIGAPDLDVRVGRTGVLMVIFGARVKIELNGDAAHQNLSWTVDTGIQLSGANTRGVVASEAATKVFRLNETLGDSITVETGDTVNQVLLLTGLNEGDTTLQMVFRRNGVGADKFDPLASLMHITAVPY